MHSDTQGSCEFICLKSTKNGLWSTRNLLWMSTIPIRNLYNNIALNPGQHGTTKHIKVDKHIISDKLDTSLNCTPFWKTENDVGQP